MINGVSISDLPGMAAPRKFPAIRALYVFAPVRLRPC